MPTLPPVPATQPFLSNQFTTLPTPHTPSKLPPPKAAALGECAWQFVGEKQNACQDCQIQAETGRTALQFAGFGNPAELKDSFLLLSDRLLEGALFG
ncbi:MAG: hypothetical protein ABIL11_00495 [Chloroflexota bacterium]